MLTGHLRNSSVMQMGAESPADRPLDQGRARHCPGMLISNIMYLVSVYNETYTHTHKHAHEQRSLKCLS